MSLAFAMCIGAANFARASETDGTIVSGGNAGYAWSDQIGWVNFGAANGNIHITDSGITGYAWNANKGWINMSPTNGGVAVAASGALSGYAWSTNAGWINFSGASINSLGKFIGNASGIIVGTLTFDCTNCDARTDYRPQNFRTATTLALSSGGGGGGGLPAEAYHPPVAPEGGFNVSINNNAAETNSRNITLILKGGPNTSVAWISEKPDFPDSFQASYQAGQSQSSILWVLSPGEGTKTIYAKFCQQWGRCSDVIFDEIIFKGSAADEVVAPSVPSGEEGSAPRTTVSPRSGSLTVSTPRVTQTPQEIAPEPQVAPAQPADESVEADPLFDIKVGPGSAGSNKSKVFIIIATTIIVAAAIVIYIFRQRKNRWTNEK